jgi:hypothetical protein
VVGRARRQAEKEKLHASFAADVDEEQAAFMADSQVPWGVDALGGTITNAAWRTKPPGGDDAGAHLRVSLWFTKEDPVSGFTHAIDWAAGREPSAPCLQPRTTAAESHIT